MSKRAMEAASLLGMNLEQQWGGHPATGEEVSTAHEDDATITLVLGPSGSGKTTRLRRMIAAARERDELVVTLGIEGERERPVPDRPPVDLFRGSVEEAMRALASAGLAEGACFVRPAHTLSTGQMFRLRLALAMQTLRRSPPRTGLLVIDEFGASLDHATGWCVAALLQRFIAETPGVRAIIATHREEFADPLSPNRIIRADHVGYSNLHDTADAPEIIIERGSPDDYAPLARFHYQCSRPATAVRVLRARPRGRGGLTGVLIVSMPTLNGSWRARAWPGHFDTGNKREDARRLNDKRAGVRCISRVVIDPRYRGMGLATQLVRAYLDDPLTPHTEAVAAMGRTSSFFERAGMRGMPVAVEGSHARLLDLFEQFGIAPRELSMPAQAHARACRRMGQALLDRELRTWSRATRANLAAARGAADSLALFRAACRTIAVRRRAFIAGANRISQDTHGSEPDERGPG